MKKILCLFLTTLLLCVCVLFAACSNSKDGADAQDVTDAIAGDDEPADFFEARRQLQDSLPEMDFNGDDIKILAFDVYKHFVMSEEDIGEIVNDAVFSVTLGVSERFNANLVHVGEGLGEIQQVDLFRRTVTAGDDAFHIAFLHPIAVPMSLEGFFVNVYDMKYLDFDKPWWNKTVIDDFTILGQCYITFPSMSYMGLARSRVLFVNEDKMEDLGLELPYDDVINGTWTLDKLITLTKGTYRDLNGSGVPDNDDFYGFISERAMYGLLDSFDMPVMGRGADGMVNLIADVGRTASLIDKLYDWIIVSDDARFLLEKDGMVGNDLTGEALAEGRALFQRGQMFEALPVLLHSNVNYGILPMPKFDGFQEEYITSCGEFIMAIPATVKGDKLDRVSVIIEAMSAESYKHVYPAYFEVALQVKYFDNQSVQMIDIINETRRTSFSNIYDTDGLMAYAPHHMLSSGGTPSRDFASFYERRENQVNGQINRLNNAFIKMDAER